MEGAPLLINLNKVISYHPAQIFKWLASGLVTGFVLGNWISLPWQISVAAVLLLIFLAWYKRPLFLVSLVILGCLIGLWRFQALPQAPPGSFFVGVQQFEANIIEPPRVGGKVARYVVAPTLDSVGNILLVAKPYPAFAYGERVLVSCKSVTALEFSGYANKGIFRECAFPEIKLLAPAQWSVKGILLKLRDAAGAQLKGLLPEPYASLSTGILWGDDAGLPPEVINSFRRTGTTHLLAVSGYNVMVLTEILFWFLIAVGFWRKSASWLVLVTVVLFVLFTGAEPAVVRAGIMGSLVIIGRLLKRRPDNINLLLGAAAAMLLVQPELINDLGFQLSFAAMAGLVFLSPKLSERLTFLPSILSIKESTAQTLAATLTTTPLILLRLGQLPLLSPLANLLVGPVVVLVFWFGLPLLFLSLVSFILAAPFAFVLSGILAYMVFIIGFLASLPWSVGHALVAWVLVIAFYLLAAWWLWFKEFKRNKAKVV